MQHKKSGNFVLSHLWYSSKSSHHSSLITADKVEAKPVVCLSWFDCVAPLVSMTTSTGVDRCFIVFFSLGVIAMPDVTPGKLLCPSRKAAYYELPDPSVSVRSNCPHPCLCLWKLDYL